MKKRNRPWIYSVCFILCLAAVLSGVWWDAQSGNRYKRAGEIAREVVSEMVEHPRIAITFDDGPSAGCTPELLSGLKERNVKAAFFLIGANAEKNPELVLREYEEGHIVGNHTYHHVDLNKVTEDVALEEIRTTNELLMRITGEQPEFLRPPFGIRKKDLEQKVEAFPVLWSIDPLDWNTENVNEIVNKVVTQAKDGDIILLHDCYESSVKAALLIIDTLQDKGFEFVRVDELIVD